MKMLLRLFLIILLTLSVMGFSGNLAVHASKLRVGQPVTFINHPLIYRPLSQGNPGRPPFVPSDIRKGYDFQPLYSHGIYGNGSIIVIIDAFGDPSLSSDLSNFDSLTGVGLATLNIFYPNGVPTLKDSGWAVETALDVEWAHAIAPGAIIDLVVAQNNSDGYIFDAINYVATHLANATVVSMSFGQNENQYPTTGPYTISNTHTQFATIVSHGTSIFASSGDSGASGCCTVSYPASDPLVVAVGGTTLSLDSSANYLSEIAWSGSGAGASAVFAKPSWQQGLGNSMRDIADVSYDADPNTGFIVVQNGFQNIVGGTSAGSPQWAALTALAAQATGVRYGSINAKLYNLTSSYHDVTLGSDGFFQAATGWDYPTGLGSPDATFLVNSLEGPSVEIRNTSLFQGLNVTTSGVLQTNTFTSTVSGTVTVNAVNATTGGVVYARNYTLTGLRIQNGTMGMKTIFLLNLPVSPYRLSVGISLTTQGATTRTLVSVTRQVSLSGSNTVNISDVTNVMGVFNAVKGSPGYNPLADLEASGSITLGDVTVAEYYFNAPVFY